MKKLTTVQISKRDSSRAGIRIRNSPGTHRTTTPMAVRGGKRTNLQIVPKSAHNFLDLLSQLASWCQHQSLALRKVVVQILQYPGAKRRSLPRSRLRLLDHIKPFRKRNNALLLNCGGFLKTCGQVAAFNLPTFANTPLRIPRTFRPERH